MGEIDFQLSYVFYLAGSMTPVFIVVFLATYLIWIQGAISILILKLKSKKYPKEIFKMLIASSAAYALNILIGLVFFRQRPFDAHGITALISTDHLDKSFPSSHASVAFAIASFVYFRYKKNAIWLFALAFLVSVGRVLAGVHYLGDIAVGAVIGIFCSWLFVRFKFFS